MKNAPFRLAAFGLLITIIRIAMFVAIIDSGFGPALGNFFAGAFAVFLAGSLYVASFYARYEKTRAAGLAGLVIFGIADLWFNEATVVFYTSGSNLVTPESNFLGIEADWLRSFMQITAVGFGALPTIGSVVLGFMQAGAAQVVAVNKPNALQRIGIALSKIVVSWGVAIAVKLESSAPKDGNFTQDSTAFPDDWRKLSVSQKKVLARMSKTEIVAAAHIEPRSADNWIASLRREGYLAELPKLEK